MIYILFNVATNSVISVADSITDTSCLSLQANSAHICCELDTGNFCEIQCNNGFCVCVDPISGESTNDLRFREDDESITCPPRMSILYECWYYCHYSIFFAVIPNSPTTESKTKA